MQHALPDASNASQILLVSSTVLATSRCKSSPSLLCASTDAAAAGVPIKPPLHQPAPGAQVVGYELTQGKTGCLEVREAVCLVQSCVMAVGLS